MIAKALASAGASKVYILGRRKEKLEAAAAKHSLIPLQCDITSKESLQATVNTINKNVGYINLLVANSGILGPTASFMPGLSIKELRKNMFEDTSMEDFTQTFQVNTTATYFSMLAFLELLDAGNKNALTGGFGKPLREGSKVPSIQSQVIVTSSVGAFLREWQCAPAYAGSKAAIAHLVKHSSTGLAPHGIRVNALAPGCSSSLSLSS
jgi:NAD(P)-dependent dehydrogenase (short-subunit alcohol dehydrogenase family)